jgi:hypothetical protein
MSASANIIKNHVFAKCPEESDARIASHELEIVLLKISSGKYTAAELAANDIVSAKAREVDRCASDWERVRDTSGGRE